MLASARTTAPLVQADALRLPVPDAGVDGATCGFALRNLVDLGPFFAELAPKTVLTRTQVQTLLTDPMERQGMARCGRQLIDGRGPDRLVTALEVLLHPAQPVGLRIAA